MVEMMDMNYIDLENNYKGLMDLMVDNNVVVG
jgi:hypothetical protein